MATMLPDSSQEHGQFRVTLFVGPQEVEGKPFAQSTVFNVKKRSWKGGVQVAVEIGQDQADRLSASIKFEQWIDEVLATVPPLDRPFYRTRAHELLLQAASRCKLDLLLQSGITQDNQCLPADTFVSELDKAIVNNRESVTYFVATELDLLADNTPPHS